MTNVTKATKRKNQSKQTEADKEKVDGNVDKKVEECKPPKYGRMPRLTRERLLSRGIFIVGIFIYVWYSTKGGKETLLAAQKDVLQQRGMQFECDPEFADEISNFPGCAPKKCGRYVSDKLVTISEAEILLNIAKRGYNLGVSVGGASILDLHSGALSYGDKFINIYTIEAAKNIFTPADLTVYKIVKEKIKRTIAQIFKIDPESLYLTHPTFFSKLNNLEPKMPHDHYWHPHVDKVTYESFHYTSLLYLSDYGRDFKGGRLIFLDGSATVPKGNVTVEPRKGRVAMFSSGAENLHYVERVTSGDRYTLTVSFTCDITKSIGDPTGHDKYIN